MTTSVSMSELMKEFSISYGLGEEGEKELINLFNKSLIEITIFLIGCCIISFISYNSSNENLILGNICNIFTIFINLL